jgi:hypothetical protein
MSEGDDYKSPKNLKELKMQLRDVKETLQRHLERLE